MNNLTAILNAKLSGIDSEEYTKQGGLIEMTDGAVQRIASMTAPSFAIKLNYSNLTQPEWVSLRDVFEQNHSNTFIYEASGIHDPRHKFIGDNASVWAFKGWEFSTDAQTRLFSGYIELVSSVYFNYPEYLALGAQSSSYNFTESIDYSFNDLLAYVSPYQVKYAYMGNSLVSSIMRSTQNIKDRGGLRKKWTLNWLVDEADFLELIKFYRKRGGVFNSFGMTDGGHSLGLFNIYLENYDDYVNEGYFENEFNYNLKATFSHDGFKYRKRVDGYYEVEADILEAR